MTVPPLDLLLLLGTLQGFILAPLLWFTAQGNRRSNRLLAGLVFLLALMSLALGLPVSNDYVGIALDLAPLVNAMPLGPLVLFYTRSLLDPSFRLGRAQWRHFYPVVLDWIPPLIGWTFMAGLLLGLLPESEGPAWGQVMDTYNVYADIPRWLSLALYVVATWRWLHKQPLAEDAERQNARWLRQFLAVFAGFLLVWLLYLVPYIIPATRSVLESTFGWYPIYIPIAALIYWIGLKGYFQTRKPSVPTVRKSSATLPEEVANGVVDRLQAAMRVDKLYLDPELTVEKVGKHLEVPARTVSLVINQHLGKSFNRFVNEYRIEAVQDRLRDPADLPLTLTGIAFECGFNSQATFQRTFKQLTGVSPKEYRHRQTVS
ncbi:MAG: helix-turn-helix transcriptional regulator [Cytophagales bacterium]|nr:helix-turn-helix transcriptional regulator [Cytophagales bacterium]